MKYAKCIVKFVDSNSRIFSYGLMGNDGSYDIVNSDQVKEAIKQDN